MPNPIDQKIIERLANDPSGEMKAYELEELLEKELAKEAEEIDPSLVSELLETLEPGDIPDGLKEKVWQQTITKKKPAYKCAPWICRFIAIAAVIVLVFGLTIGAAQAFRWTFLLKLLKPVAQTFGIYLNYADDQPTAIPEISYGVSQEETSQVMYDDLSALPDEHQGYALKPGWIPEGYAFVQASSFVDSILTKYAICYQRGTDELNVFIMFYPDLDTTSSQFFERTDEIVTERIIGSKMVTFYRNANDQIQSVSWLDGNAHYCIAGHIAADDVDKMVESFSNTQAE